MTLRYVTRRQRADGASVGSRAGQLLALTMLLNVPGAGRVSHAAEPVLTPVRITGYFDWIANTDKKKPLDGDFRSAQSDAYPEMLTSGKSQALVRAVTQDGRTTLRVLTGFEKVLENSKRRLFDTEANIPPGGVGSGGDAFDAPALAAAIASFGGGLYRVANYPFATQTCDTAQIDLQAAFDDFVAQNSQDLNAHVFPITCRDMVDVVALGSGERRTYMLFDGNTVAIARRQGAEVAEIANGDLKAWIGGGDRRFLSASIQDNADEVRLAVAVESASGSLVCLSSFRRADLEAGKLPKQGCPQEPAFRAAPGSVIVEMSWRPNGTGLAVLATDQKSRKSELVLLENAVAKPLSRAVLVPQVTNVPYVAKPTLAWVGNTLWWLEEAGRKSIATSYDGAQTIRYGLPDESPRTAARCGMAASWGYKPLDTLCLGAGEDRDAYFLREGSEILGRNFAKVDDLFSSDADWFSKSPAWITLTCTTAEKPPLVRVARLVDVSWFIPLKRPADGKTYLIAAVVAHVAADGVDDHPYTARPPADCMTGERKARAGMAQSVSPLPPVVRLAVFEVAR